MKTFLKQKFRYDFFEYEPIKAKSTEWAYEMQDHSDVATLGKKYDSFLFILTKGGWRERGREEKREERERKKRENFILLNSFLFFIHFLLNFFLL